MEPFYGQILQFTEPLTDIEEQNTNEDPIICKTSRPIGTLCHMNETSFSPQKTQIGNYPREPQHWFNKTLNRNFRVGNKTCCFALICKICSNHTTE